MNKYASKPQTVRKNGHELEEGDVIISPQGGRHTVTSVAHIPDTGQVNYTTDTGFEFMLDHPENNRYLVVAK